MPTARDRQLRREADAINNEIAKLPKRKARSWSDQRAPANGALVTQEQSAYLNRHMVPIVSAQHKDPKTGEIKSVVQTYRVGTVVDKMQGLSPEQIRAYDILCEFAANAYGHSQGVSSYGEYVQGAPASQRSLTSNQKMKARPKFETACRCMFGIECDDGSWEIDYNEADTILKAFDSTNKEISKKWVGAQLTHYEGAGQKQAIGDYAIRRALDRLAIHLRIKKPWP